MLCYGLKIGSHLRVLLRFCYVLLLLLFKSHFIVFLSQKLYNYKNSCVKSLELRSHPLFRWQKNNKFLIFF